ncbi:RICIN domain-containing protein [Streptomyces sp. NPDC059247]|uniref:RICIN domain-containing protein n=1 Tax=Streptomyces sp. NPDC059247 TaxID=3346790 RepID=UPI0036852817
MAGNRNSGLCMHASSGGGAGAWVTQEVCNQNEPGQWWSYTFVNGNVVMYNMLGNCLDAHNGANPGTVIVWGCHGGQSQQFFDGRNGILSVPSGQAVEPPGLSKQPGTQLIMWWANGTLNQQWWRMSAE